MRDNLETDEDSGVLFTERELGLIARSLSECANRDRLELLPKIMRDWGRTDFPVLSLEEPEHPSVRKVRRKRFEAVEATANQLGHYRELPAAQTATPSLRPDHDHRNDDHD